MYIVFLVWGGACRRCCVGACVLQDIAQPYLHKMTIILYRLASVHHARITGPRNMTQNFLFTPLANTVEETRGKRANGCRKLACNDDEDEEGADEKCEDATRESVVESGYVFSGKEDDGGYCQLRDLLLMHGDCDMLRLLCSLTGSSAHVYNPRDARAHDLQEELIRWLK